MPTKRFDWVKSKRPTTPLYHYTSTEGLIGIVESKSLRASAIQYLNDTAEYKHAASVIRTLLYEYILTNEPPPPIYDVFLKALQYCSNATAFAGSLSEEEDKLSQWRGYCSNGGGFSIGFSAGLIEQQAEKQGFEVVKCLYDANVQREICAELIASARSAAEAIQINDRTKVGQKVAESLTVLSTFVGPFTQIAAVLKDPTFEEEQEWRVVRGPFPEAEGPPPGVCFRPGKYAVIPYLNFALAEENDPLQLEEIIIGPNPDPGQAKRSVEYFLKAKNVRCRNVREYSGTLRNW